MKFWRKGVEVVKSTGDVSDMCSTHLLTSTLFTRNIFFNNVSHLIKHHKHTNFGIHCNRIWSICLFRNNPLVYNK